VSTNKQTLLNRREVSTAERMNNAKCKVQEREIKNMQ